MKEYLLAVDQSKQRLDVAFADWMIKEGVKVKGASPLLLNFLNKLMYLYNKLRSSFGLWSNTFVEFMNQIFISSSATE